MVLETLATAIGGKLAVEFIKKLGKKVETPPIEKAFEEAVCAFAEGFSLKDTENEGILRSFFENDNVRKELMYFTGFFGGMPDVEALKKEFVKAGFVEEQMQGFNFEQGILKFVKTFKDISSQNSELQPFLQTKVQEEILKELRKVTERITPPTPDLEEAEKNYLKQIQLQNRYVDARGIAQMKNIVQLELDQIFVPLKAKKEVPRADTRRREEMERRKEEREGEREEFELLREESIKREEPPLRIDDILKTQQNLVILGDPGSGKTTLLKHLTFRAASGGLGKGITDGKKLLPIFLPIRQYSAALSKGACRSLKGYLPLFFEENESPLPDEVLEKKLQAGECLLLFDGLDEVFDTHKRHEVVDDIANFLNRYSDNRFILTSRIAGYSAAPMVGDFPHYTLEDFGLQEIEQFVHKWCWAMENIEQKEVTSRKRAEENAKELFDAIKMNERVLKLASNPLMCTIIGLIHNQGQKLPNRRIELYNICADTFITSWELLKRQKIETHYQLDERDVRAILEYVALWMHRNTENNLVRKEVLEERVIEFLIRNTGKTRIDAEKQTDAFVESVRLRTGILLEKGEKLFGFMHLTFQEYFAACALTKQRRKFISEIGTYVRKPRWKEVILLAAAKLGDQNPEDASELVRAILNVEDEYEKYLHRNLLLAGLCLADDVMLDFDLRKEILDRLAHWFKETAISSLRERIASVLGSMGRTRSEPESLNILLSGLFHRDWLVRQSALDGLGKLGSKDKEVVEKLMVRLGDGHGSVRSSAAQALGALGVSKLGSTGKDKEVVEKLMGRLGNGHGSVRSSTAQALGALGVKDKGVVEKLMVRLGDGHGSVRSSAAQALGAIGIKDKEVVEKLVGRLGDEDVSVRFFAGQALGAIGIKDKEVVEKLVGKLGDEYWSVRSSAAQALGAIGVKDKEVVEKLMDGLGDEEASVRSSAVRALGALGVKHKEVVEKLMGRLGDEHWYVRFFAAQALGAIGIKDKEVVEKLMGGLGDQHGSVRSSAAQALGAIGIKDKEVVEKLMGRLGDEYGNVRSSAAQALGAIGVKDKEVVEKLMGRLGDEDESVRSSAAQALGALGVKDKEVVEKLIDRLGDEDWSVRSSAYEALEKLTAE